MEEQLDLRIRKTYLSLTNTLLEMMEEMPFEDIRVKDLCERAMLRKSTFYKHFADKYELLNFVVRQTMDGFDEQAAKKGRYEQPAAYYERLLESVFDFVEQNEKLIRSGMKSDSVALVLNLLAEQVTPTLQKKLEEDEKAGYHLPASAQVTAAFFAGAVAENLKDWILSGRKMPKKELIGQLSSIINLLYQAANPN